MTRDTSRDGLSNRLRNWVLTSGRPIWALSNQVPLIHKPVNRALIHNAINMTRARPHPLSTMSDYSSVDSLRDRTFFSRHLPPVPQPSDLPSADAATALFQRKGAAKLSSKSTVLFAAFAQWFTDGFLLTDIDNRLKNHSTHDLDLAQLYGSDPKVTAQLRLNEDVPGRRGRLKTQVLRGEEYPPFLYDASGTRVPEFDAVPEPLGLHPGYDREKLRSLFAFGGERTNSTPQTAMINVLMLREHNRLCSEIESAYPAWHDERIFQTARNALIVIQLRIVLEEYINHIHPYHHTFTLDPGVAWKARWNRPCWFAVEFNLLYRWHSLIPDVIEWGAERYRTEDWRLDNRPLISAGLGMGFEASSWQHAGELGLGNTPAALIPTEKKAIEQGRMARLASYNEYRAAMKYPRIERFEQISSSPDTVRALRELYGHVDRIEFYVGLFAEDARPNAAVPALLGRMVALDALSQALVNPLCSEHVYNDRTFSKVGWKRIQQTRTLADLVARNVVGGERLLVAMTHPSAELKPGRESGKAEGGPAVKERVRELARDPAFAPGEMSRGLARARARGRARTRTRTRKLGGYHGWQSGRFTRGRRAHGSAQRCRWVAAWGA